LNNAPDEEKVLLTVAAARADMLGNNLVKSLDDKSVANAEKLAKEMIPIFQRKGVTL
jgi:hypothetical protein